MPTTCSSSVVKRLHTHGAFWWHPPSDHISCTCTCWRPRGFHLAEQSLALSWPRRCLFKAWRAAARETFQGLLKSICILDLRRSAVRQISSRNMYSLQTDVHVGVEGIGPFLRHRAESNAAARQSTRRVFAPLAKHLPDGMKAAPEWLCTCHAHRALRPCL